MTVHFFKRQVDLITQNWKCAQSNIKAYLTYLGNFIWYLCLGLRPDRKLEMLHAMFEYSGLTVYPSKLSSSGFKLDNKTFQFVVSLFFLLFGLCKPCSAWLVKNIQRYNTLKCLVIPDAWCKHDTWSSLRCTVGANTDCNMPTPYSQRATWRVKALFFF